MPTSIVWLGTAHIHTPGFSEQILKRGVQCAGIWDHNAERASMNAEKLSGPVLTLDQALKVPTDGYLVCSETIHHLELVEKFAGTKKPIFIEKPMGFNGEQSQKILELLEASGNAFQTGYFSRGSAGIRTLKKLYQADHFGTVTRVRVSNCHSGALGGWFDGDWRWMANRELAGVGAFGDLGTHMLDVMLWIFGPVTTVTGVLSNGTSRYPGCEELGEAMMKFKNGAIGTLAASWDDVADPIRFQVMGTEGHAYLLGNDLFVAGKDGKFSKMESLEPAVSAGFGAWLDALEGKAAELVTPREAAQRDIVMEAIYQGSTQQSWVEVCSDWQ